MHIIALKATKPSDYKRPGVTENCRRYNYIVHPLAYRGEEGIVPDESVDGMQWTICNANNKDENIVPSVVPMPETDPKPEANPEDEKIKRQKIIANVKNSGVAAFGDKERWGERCHGVEVFNDFT